MPELTNEDKQILVELAVRINDGAIPMDLVMKKFTVKSSTSEDIIQFWKSYNDVTRQTVEKILIRQFLELCYFLSEDEE